MCEFHNNCCLLEVQKWGLSVGLAGDAAGISPTRGASLGWLSELYLDGFLTSRRHIIACRYVMESCLLRNAQNI
jgi:hypothetical protein